LRRLADLESNPQRMLDHFCRNGAGRNEVA
jgi:hypothetical protein